MDVWSHFHYHIFIYFIVTDIFCIYFTVEYRQPTTMVHGFALSVNHRSRSMLGAHSRVWLANKRGILTRISRLTSSALDVKRKERLWWRHNGDHDHSPLSLPLWCDRVTLFIRWFIPDKREIWDSNVAQTFENVTNILRSWDEFVTPCLLLRIQEFIHT